MIKLATTRWLTMQHAIKRVLDNWNSLYRFFQVAKLEENSKVVDYLYDELNNSCTKAFLLFLSYILNFFNTFNALFQSKKVLIHELSEQCKKLFRQFLSHFCKPECLNNSDINCEDPGNFLKLESIDLGRECNNFISNLPKTIQDTIRKSCLEFLITAATNIKKRFPLSDEFFNSLKFLKPQIALNMKRPIEITSLEVLWSKFKFIEGIDGCNIDQQWKNIPLDFSCDDEKDELLKMEVAEFWKTLGEKRNFQDELEYAAIVKLARICMALPHSNAETERVFSVVTDVKTKKRNKISSEALNSVAVIRFASNDCCQSFQVSDNHLKLMESHNLYKT